MTNPPNPALGRRWLLGISVSAAGAVALSACDKPRPKAAEPGAPAEDEVPVTPPEDLMREHGVLKRVLLIYREGIRRLQASEQLPADALNAGAAIIRVWRPAVIPPRLFAVSAKARGPRPAGR